MLPPDSPVVVYVRVSTEDQKRHGTSPELQEAYGRSVCERLGLRLVEVVYDLAESSKDLNRPGLKTILPRLASGEVRGLVLHSVDRLSRSIEDAETLRKRYFQSPTGAWLIADGSYQDTRSAVGRFMFRALVVASQLQRELGIEKTISTLGHKRETGQLTSRPKWGWKTDPDNPARSKTDKPIGLVRDQDDHEVLRLLRNWTKEVPRPSLATMAGRLDLTNLRPKRGGEWWSRSSVAKRLREDVLDAQDATDAQGRAGEPTTPWADAKAELLASPEVLDGDQ